MPADRCITYCRHTTTRNRLHDASGPKLNEITRIALQPEDKGRRSQRGKPKGRPVDPLARDQVRMLLGDAPRSPDQLIEHLHKLQDHFGHLSAAHLEALAQEMRLAQAEVFEVATFYHHFDVVREGEAAPPRLTVRV